VDVILSLSEGSVFDSVKLNHYPPLFYIDSKRVIEYFRSNTTGQPATASDSGP